jgi:predicted membrane protein
MKRILGALLLVGAAASPGLTSAQEDVDARRKANPDCRVEIENMAGSIRVIGWAREEVQVTGELGRGAEGLDISGSPDDIQIEVDVHGPGFHVNSDLEIHVPAGAEVDIEAFNADITVSKVTGSVEANTVNGNIRVDGSRGEVDVQTVNGDVEVSGTATKALAESVNGTVRIRGVSGDVEALTVNGELVVTGGQLHRGSLETVAGSIRFEGGLASGADVDIESVSGEVELLLDPDVSADIQVSSFSGEIENDFGPESESVSRYTSEKELRFETGGGDARISIETLSGNVYLRRR